MKKFNVSANCIACGMCVIMTDLLEENNHGKVYAIESGYISEEYLFEANKIVEICPVDAISIVEVKSVKGIGEQGLKDLGEILENKLKDIKKVFVTKQDINFNSNNYSIDFGDAKGQYNYIYSNSSQAEAAGIAEFNRIAYSQYRPFILSVFVQYKNDKLKPYYTFDDSSFYAKFNHKYEKILNEIVAEAQSLSSKSISFPDDFTKFDVYPGGLDSSYRENVTYTLRHFEEKSTQSGIIAEFKSGSYSSLDSYKMYVDTDDMEVYCGEDWRGRSKFKVKYCYYSVYNAVKEFISDLKNAMNYVDIDETALYFLSGAIDSYNKEIDKEVEKKIKIFNEVVSK